MSLAEAVRREYGKLAPSYDRRWERYVRLTAHLTLDALELTAGTRLLDVGCGTGFLLGAALRRQPAVWLAGVDISGPMLERARVATGGAALLTLAAAEALPFPDGSFDAVVTTSSLHYWQRPGTGLRELVRVVRRGGSIVVTDWSADALSVRVAAGLLRRAGAPVGTVQTSAELRGLLDQEGVERIDVAHASAGFPWRVHRVAAVRPYR